MRRTQLHTHFALDKKTPHGRYTGRPGIIPCSSPLQLSRCRALPSSPTSSCCLATTSPRRTAPPHRTRSKPAPEDDVKPQWAMERSRHLWTAKRRQGNTTFPTGGLRARLWGSRRSQALSRRPPAQSRPPSARSPPAAPGSAAAARRVPRARGRARPRARAAPPPHMAAAAALAPPRSAARGAGCLAGRAPGRFRPALGPVRMPAPTVAPVGWASPGIALLKCVPPHSRVLEHEKTRKQRPVRMTQRGAHSFQSLSLPRYTAGLQGTAQSTRVLAPGQVQEGGQRSQSRHCGLEQNLWAAAWLGLGQAPHGLLPPRSEPAVSRFAGEVRAVAQEGEGRLPSLLPRRHCCPGPRTEGQVSSPGSSGLTHTNTKELSQFCKIFLTLYWAAIRMPSENQSCLEGSSAEQGKGKPWKQSWQRSRACQADITGWVPCLAVQMLASQGRRHGQHKAKGRSILQAAGNLE